MAGRAPNLREGKRIALLSRTTPDLRRALEAAASQSGRSLGQEVEHRLEQSFDREAIVRDLARVMREDRDADVFGNEELLRTGTGQH